MIGVESHEYLPYFSVIDSEYTGLGREILDSFAKARGHNFTYVVSPIKKLNQAP